MSLATLNIMPSMSDEAVFVEHKPHLAWPWQVRVRIKGGKSVMIMAYKTEGPAERAKERLQLDRAGRKEI